MRQVIKESQLRTLIKNAIYEAVNEVMLNEIQNKINNFQKRAQFIDNYNQKNGANPDNVWFIQTMIRKKDNPNKDLKAQYPNEYHGGAVYGNFSNGTAFLVHDGQELLTLESQIVNFCDTNNARAVMWLNPRSESAVKAYCPKFRSSLVNRYGKPLPVTDPRNIYALELLYGQCKFDRKNFPERKYCKYDIDSTDPKVQDFCIKTIKQYLNLPDECFEKTASGGLHVICPDQYDPIMKKLSYELRWLDRGQRDIKTHKISDYPDLGFQQTAHFNEDANVILYANVDTKGY
jgi:hypothetical protein